MAIKATTAGFGRKESGVQSMTFAQALLTGQPLGRDVKKYTPTLKPRQKPRFGTKGLVSFPINVDLPPQDQSKSWKFWR